MVIPNLGCSQKGWCIITPFLIFQTLLINYANIFNLASGFHQIEMEEPDIEKMTFSPWIEHYEFLHIPFQLKNNPATFQCYMDNIHWGIQTEQFFFNLQLNVQLRKSTYNFEIQLNKSEFLWKEISYLGDIVTPDGVKPNRNEVKAIMNFSLPVR